MKISVYALHNDSVFEIALSIPFILILLYLVRIIALMIILKKEEILSFVYNKIFFKDVLLLLFNIETFTAAALEEKFFCAFLIQYLFIIVVHKLWYLNLRELIQTSLVDLLHIFLVQNSWLDFNNKACNLII